MHPAIFLSGWLVLAAFFALQEWVDKRTWNYDVQFGKVYLLWAIHFLLWGIICWISGGSWENGSSEPRLSPSFCTEFP